MKANLMLGLLFLVGVVVRGNLAPQPTPNLEVAATSPPTALTGDKAIQHLQASGHYESLGAAVTAARYAVHPVEPGGSRGDENTPTSWCFPQRTVIARGPDSEALNLTVHWQAQTAAPPPAATAANAAQGIVSTFTPEGLRLQVRAAGDTDAPLLVSEWRLASVGYGEEQIAVPPGELRVEGQRTEIIRGAPATPPSESRVPHLAEWFVNTPGGLEHGFTLYERPRRSRGDETHSSSPLPTSTLTSEIDQSLLTSAPTMEGEKPLRVILAVSGDLTPHAEADGQRLELRDAEERPVLTYKKLKVWDAAGVELRATMSTSAGEVLLSVDDMKARYPLTIDPTFVQQAYLKAAGSTDSHLNEDSGYSVAISGNRVVIGAPGERSSATGVNSTPNASAFHAGAAYVFVHNAGVWSQQAYLKPAAVGSSQNFNQFGASVAISGDTVVVGARGEDSSTTGVNSTPDGSAYQAGAAYVFVHSAGVWSQQAYLKPAAVGTSQEMDWFGFSVAISDDTVVVGASSEDSSTTGVNSAPDESANGAGAAYVFVRSAGVWTQQAYLKPAAVGTSQVDDTFGRSVAISDDTVVVGAANEASSSTGVNSTPNESGPYSGAAYVFVRSSGVWTQQAYLKPSAVGTYQDYDRFGESVAVSGDTVVVGAPWEDSSMTGVNSTPNESAYEAGAAHVFVRSAGVWTQQAYLKPAAVGTSQAGDQFGHSVAISGDTVVIGAPYEASSTAGVNGVPDENSFWAGAAYLFARGGGVWSQHAYLKQAAVGTSQRTDFFGWSVAISGDTVVVGVPGDDSAPPSSGAAHVFSIRPTLRGQVDLVGETELTGTVMRAEDGPDGTGGRVVLAAPYHGEFVVEGLRPSSVEDPPNGYLVRGSLSVRTGRRHEFFDAPALGHGLNAAVELPADRDLNLGDTFVMRPGWVSGRLLLQGPQETVLGHESALRHIVRLHEPGADYGLLPGRLDSRVMMQGRDERSAGAAYSAAGALARASFEGEFNPARSAFEGDYELVLAGLNGDRTRWEELTARLLLRGGSLAAPESHVNHTLLLRELANPQYFRSLEIGPGERLAVDLNVCFSEVEIEVETPSGPLWNPVATIEGGFSTGDAGHRLDFQRNARRYFAEALHVRGSPAEPGLESRGRIVVLLPEGEYSIAMQAEVEDPPGTSTVRSFPAFSVRVGCGERLRVAPGLSVTIPIGIECDSGGEVRGAIATPAGVAVSQLFWSGPDGINQLLCEDCGENPSFSFRLPPAAFCGDSTYTVTAFTADGRRVSRTRPVPRDATPPRLVVGDDKTVECGSGWDFDPATATDDCAGSVPVSVRDTITTRLDACTTQVERFYVATDPCGNTSERSQRVTVVDTTPPIVFCPDIVVDCPQVVSYTVAATDLCGDVVGTFNPPNGSYFGPGVTRVRATATDPCGRTTVCDFNVTVRGACTPPVARDDEFLVPAGSRVVIPAAALLANDADPDGDPLLVTAHDPATTGGGTLTSGGSPVTELLYTPPAAPPTGATEDTFTYRVTDGMATATATVRLRSYATALVYEGFDYRPGDPLAATGAPIHNGGVGWSGAWTTDPFPNGFEIGGASLTGPSFAALPVSGGSISESLGLVGHPRDQMYVRRPISPIPTGVGDRLWFSVVVRSSAEEGSKTSVIFVFNDDTSNPGLGFHTGSPTGSAPLRWALGAYQTSHGPPIVPGTPTLLAAEMTRASDTQWEFRLFVSPTPGATAPPPDQVEIFSGPGRWQRLTGVLIVVQQAGLVAAFDEIRVGRSFASVTTTGPALMTPVNVMRIVSATGGGSTFTLPFGAPGPGTYMLERRLLGCGTPAGPWTELTRVTVGGPEVIAFVDGAQPCGALYRVRSVP